MEAGAVNETDACALLPITEPIVGTPGTEAKVVVKVALAGAALLPLEVTKAPAGIVLR